VTLLWVLLPLAGYLLGSVSFAWVAGRLKGVDLRQRGSGNLGATNAGRVLGLGWFFAVFCCDVGKGVTPVLAGRLLPEALGYHIGAIEAQALPIAAGAAAVFGHVFTLFHGFRGGKAVATSLGVLAGLLPLTAAILLLLWLLLFGIIAALHRGRRSDAVGPASVLSALAAPLIYGAQRHLADGDPFAAGERLTTAFVVLMAVLVLLRHRSNIARIVRIGRSDKDSVGEDDAAQRADASSE